jgi:hypothetical protein
MQEPNIITLSPGLMQQFNRLKILGRFNNEQALLHACFDAMERELSQRPAFAAGHPGQPYMSHPGLSPDDYDT